MKALFDLDDDGDREQFNDTLRVSFDLMSARLRGIFKLPLWVPTPETLCLKKSISRFERKVEGSVELRAPDKSLVMTCCLG